LNIKEEVINRINDLPNRFLEEQLRKQIDKDIAVLSDYSIISKEEAVELLMLLYKC